VFQRGFRHYKRRYGNYSAYGIKDSDTERRRDNFCSYGNLSYNAFYKNREKELMPDDLLDWLESVSPVVKKNIAENGNVPAWLCALEKFPKIECDCFAQNGKVVISCEKKTDNEIIRAALREFMPWRKGPWKILNIDIDTEWRSDLKWERVAKLCDFTGKIVLDIGSSNGYYCYRAALSGAKFVLGVDPSVYSYFQSQIPAKLCPQIPVKTLPLAQSDLPKNMPVFDIVFSMGVLYHHKNPEEHLSHIYDLLAENGEIILETLVVDDEKYPNGLTPKGRYAKMRNVYLIPSISRVESLLKSMNFKNIRLADITKTTSAEQRKTAWMDFESLEDFLDKDDNSKTREGYPAPTRAIFAAGK
jgi:tRNA (mo5U34)-methyltransferase